MSGLPELADLDPSKLTVERRHEDAASKAVLGGRQPDVIARKIHLTSLAQDFARFERDHMPQSPPAPVGAEALAGMLAEYHRVMTTPFDPTKMMGEDYDRTMMSNCRKLVQGLPAVIRALSGQSRAAIAKATSLRPVGDA